MKRPTDVNVGGAVFEIAFTSDMLPDRDLMGVCDYNTRVIRVLIMTDEGHDYNEEALHDILCHEIDHAINWRFNGNAASVDMEYVSNSRGQGWSQVIHDNPILVKWLQGGN